MPIARHDMFPANAAEGDALLKKTSLIFSALAQFETRANKDGALKTLMVDFAQAANQTAPATQAQMERAYRYSSQIGMSEALEHGVALHKALLERIAFIKENRHIHKPTRAYVADVKETIERIEDAIPYFHQQANGFLDANRSVLSEAMASFAYNQVETLYELFQIRQQGRGLSAPEIVESGIEYDIERGHQGRVLSKALRNTLITGLSLMQKEIGFYGYAYGNSDYPQIRLGECTRIDSRDDFCKIQNHVKGLMQWLATCKGYVDYEVALSPTKQAKSADQSPLRLMH